MSLKLTRVIYRGDGEIQNINNSDYCACTSSVQCLHISEKPSLIFQAEYKLRNIYILSCDRSIFAGKSLRGAGGRFLPFSGVRALFGGRACPGAPDREVEICLRLDRKSGEPEAAITIHLSDHGVLPCTLSATMAPFPVPSY